jgi:tetratricopeptide (TPR) repeat protein
VVEACKEYLKALEVMEERFEEKDLTGKRAKFMTYTYNRLTRLFSAQYMMDPAIACGERALMFCKIEPTSSTAISNILLYLGIQHDKKNEIEKARRYYVQALEELTSTDNLVYRDIVSSKALCDYQMGKGLIQSIETLRGVLRQAEDESECLTRYLTIGTIFYKEGMYDSALFYLEPIMDNKEDKRLRMDAAEQLRVIYEHLGNVEKSEECMRYIALHNEPAAEDKALVSKLEDMFKAYTDRKQEKETEKARKKAVKKAVGIIIPVAIVVALVIIVLAKLRSKQLLRNKEKRHQKELEAKEAKTREELAERDKRHVEALEAERHAHYMKQSSLSGRLKRSNEEVRELKDQIKWQDDAAAKNKTVASFTDEPICRLILERVKEGRFKSKMNYAVYKNYALNKQQLLDLRLAANRHFKQFTIRIKKSYPELTNSDLDYCCLYLLGLTDADIAALMQRAYNTVVERDGKLKRILGNDNPLPFTLMGIAKS